MLRRWCGGKVRLSIFISCPLPSKYDLNGGFDSAVLGGVLMSLVVLGYLYICGDAKHMAREVEATLEDTIGESMGGGRVEGANELKVLKERKRILLDVWS